MILVMTGHGFDSLVDPTSERNCFVCGSSRSSNLVNDGFDVDNVIIV